MQETFEPTLRAHVLRDDNGRARSIRHTQEHWASEQGSPAEAALDYVREMAGVYEVPNTELANLHVHATHLDPRPLGMEYRLDEEIANFDAMTFGFDQTVMNTPVWGAGIKVTVKTGPNRVVASVNTSHDALEVTLPPEETIGRFKKIFQATDVGRLRRGLGDEPSETEAVEGSKMVMESVGLSAKGRRSNANRAAAARLIRGRFWVYEYDEAARLPAQGKKVADRLNRNLGESGSSEQPPDDPAQQLSLPLPPVSDEISDGGCYLVAEITFEAPAGKRERVTWQALVELETGSVLYLRPLSGDVDGQVFSQDPPTKTGNTALSSASNNATLNPHRDTVTLLNLGAPVGGTQSLSGTYGRLAEVEGDAFAAPTQPTGSHFLYPARTNNFAAVSAYFHVDRIFRTIADLGFTIAGPSGYFNNTTFPISLDHRCFVGSVINAHCVGNGVGGIGHVGYGIMDTTDLANPLGRACDPRVHWHEVCGHGILYEFVNSPNFGFSHSAGDSLSGIFFDPESHLWGVDGTPLGKPGDLRFTYVPWHPSLNRRFDRTTATGWAWNGAQDDAGYGSEEILATTLFRVYRSIGGDSTDLNTRKFASRMMMYLILRAVQNLTPASNPAYARNFASELMTADDLNWTSEGVYGGAYGKVVRWSFELQGEYQVPLVTNGGPGDGTITTRGLPPLQDVYIDDGRAGEYQYQPVHWHTTTVWNRRTNDALPGHQEPELGSTNYIYVKVKNRGTQTATNVIVRGFHTKPGAGLLWPNDFEAFTTAQIAVGTIGANNTEEKLVGPFSWTPNINGYGHDCILMVASSDADASNVDKFTAGEVIPEWRLVPNDNNIAQRNVNPVPGGGGPEGLIEGLDGIGFWIGNPNPRRATFALNVELPDVLSSRGWRLTFEGLPKDSLVLKSGERREVVIRLHAGQDFTRDAIEATDDRDINIMVLADGNLIGGMTYHLDPSISKPHNGRRPGKKDCTDSAKALLDCLGIPNQDVETTQVKEIVVGFRIREKDC